MIDTIHYDAPLGKSDHVLLIWDLKLSCPEMRGAQTKYNYHKGDFVAIQNSLQCINWNERWKDKSISEMWCDLVQLLQGQVVVHVPQKQQYKKKRKRLSSRTQRLIKRRSAAWKKYCLYQSGRNWSEYKKIRNEVNHSVRKDEEFHRKRIFKSFKDRPKKFYGFMRNTQTVKDQVTVLKRPDGVMTTSDQEVADVFSEYFKEVYTVEDLSNMPKVSVKDYNWDDAICFSKEVVLDKLQKLRTDKSPGPDALHPMLLKECAAKIRLVVLESGLGLESGLKSVFAGLGLGL